MLGKADRPGRAAEAHHEAGGGENQKSGEQNRVEVALREREAQEIAGLFRGRGDGRGDGLSVSRGGVFGVWIRHFFLPTICCFTCWKRDRMSHSTVCSRKKVSTLASNRFMNSRM